MPDGRLVSPFSKKTLATVRRIKKYLSQRDRELIHGWLPCLAMDAIVLPILASTPGLWSDGLLTVHEFTFKREVQRLLANKFETCQFSVEKPVWIPYQTYDSQQTVLAHMAFIQLDHY